MYMQKDIYYGYQDIKDNNIVEVETCVSRQGVYPQVANPI